MTAGGIDLNDLETAAQSAQDAGDFQRAIAIYAWMGTGDPSLDGGYIGQRLGECYERIGQPMVARYWYRCAVEENPEVNLKSKAALEQLDQLNVRDLLEACP